ncbi:hypothetical protein LLS1_04210 [Leifsonia sp. LS1]|uniref:endonuclease/exonuclease/phosphatase family protein n=1 Tax=Leifsonia sp. LS1 TaxID=2828483 RepID=UPI001CFF41AB|nr:endonuclease/exonuclease/phosphatase family protein [Leifsonia sp. LS1]GIT78752.1 hypothetical protein LLS1_04210 [Leifsonia sp. LS1]
MTTRRPVWRRRIVAALASVALGLVAGLGAVPAAAAGATLTVSAAELDTSGTVAISYDATGSAGAKNWIGIYRHGQKPGSGSSSLDWRYAPGAGGSFTWGPGSRDGWTHEAATIGAGDLDVYLLANDGYGVLAGPVALRVRVQTVPPKPAVDGVSELDVLSFNIWKGGSVVSGGIQHAADVIRESGADVAFLPERFDPRLADATPAIADQLGYHSVSATDTGLVSRYPIVSTATVGARWTKAIIDVNGTDVAVYGGHLEYRWYAEYLPRGYGPTAIGDWPAEFLGGGELSAPVTDVATMLTMNAQSGRPDSARELLADVDAEKKAGRLVVVGGDFNEPSAQDWTAATAGLFDHRGAVVPWQTTRTLLDGGLADSYRQAHPDPVKNPGFTWPAGNPNVSVNSLTWAPKADERDRIDYVFYAPSSRLELASAAVVGPRATIVRSQRVDDDSDDVIVTPDAVWPSDHKAVLSRFRVCAESCVPDQPGGPTTGQESVTADASRVGSPLIVRGSGFLPGAAVTIELHSEPTVLGTVEAGQDGAFRFEVTVPAGTAPGDHSLVALIDGAEVARTAVRIDAAADTGGGTGPSDPGASDPGSMAPGSTAPGSSLSDPSTSRELASTGSDAVPTTLIAVAVLLLGLVLAIGRRGSLLAARARGGRRA